MSDDDIDFDRVVSDPAYRRRVIEYLNVSSDAVAGEPGRARAGLSAGRAADRGKAAHPPG